MTEERGIEFPAHSDDWGTVTHIFYPGMPEDVKFKLGNVTIEYYTVREMGAVEFGARCLDDA